MTWPDVALQIWHDVRGEVISAGVGFLAGWLGLKRPRLSRRQRKEDTDAAS